MGKINLLSSSVFNRIAAGEVIDRPYSVVKELVENSIDAGANKIIIDVTDGGLSEIKITDNGEGIMKEDLKSALLPHATSKISDVKDLDDIKTLGFRGEALASIASVSKITIESQRENDSVGGKIYCEGGVFGDINDTYVGKGTIITVNNLFFNTPVRAKFLKSVKSEENEIYSTVSRFILGNPDISFILNFDGEKKLQSFGDGLESAFLSVYGIDVLDKCFYINTEKNGIKLTGYIGKHFFTKPNRSYQTVFLNKRYVINQTISSAVSNAYSSYLMKRQYPFYFINIDMPSDAVDVNVHPNKIDVRFLNNQIVYGAVYSIISKVLDGSSEALEIASSPIESAIHNNNVNADKIVLNSDTHNIGCKPIAGVNYAPKFAPIKVSDISPTDEAKESPAIDIFAENKKYIEELERKRKEAENNNAQQKIIIDKELRVIGQALNTFLILEDGTDIYFIDQHAAHERLLYDKITADYSDGKIIEQPLLVPYIKDVSTSEAEFLDSKVDFFKSIGFEIENFGLNTYRVSTVPAYFSDIDIKKFLDDVLSDINTLKTLSVERLLFDKLAQKACKSAIKAGDKLSDNEIDALLSELKGNLGLKCPHGRPIAIKITRTEIDKWFKRIV